MRLEPLIGKTFGKWTVVGWDQKRNRWTTICECGRWGKKRRCDLTAGTSTQCMRCYSSRLDLNESAFNAVWNDYVQQSKRRKLDWKLTKEEAKEFFQQSCFYCGCLPYAIKTIPNGRGSFTFNGLDRKDNAVGYTVENCLPCCRTCNFMKMNMPMRDFFIHIHKIAQNHPLTNRPGPVMI